MIKKIILRFLDFFRKKSHSVMSIPSEIKGEHDCGLRALYIVLPGLSVEKMIEAFSNCCDWWPYKGVSNKEFNISLSYLKVKNKFDYTSRNNIQIKDLTAYKEDTFIALIYGHYIVIKKGFCLENWDKKTKVYCYWRLK